MNNLFKILFATLCVSGFCFAAPWLGVTFKKTQYENHLALAVVGVHPNSGCFSIGLAAGDTIVGVGGQKLESIAQLQKIISSGQAGQNMPVEFIQNGKRQTKTAKLTERPDDISSLTGSAIGSKIAEFGKNFYQNGEKRLAKPKATLLDFWATWCGPCRKTLPVLANVYSKYASQGLEVIGVANESVSVLNQFYTSQHASPYPLYRDADQSLWRRYGINAVPTLMLLDGDGYIKRVWSGAPSEAMVEKLVLEILNEKK